MKASLSSLAASFKNIFKGRKTKAITNVIEMNNPVKEDIKPERKTDSSAFGIRARRAMAYRALLKRTKENKVAKRRAANKLGSVTRKMNFKKAKAA